MTKILISCASIVCTSILLPIQLLAFNFSSTPKEISAHYIAPPQEMNTLITKLTKNGFTIVAITNILEDYDIITISNQELQSTNSYMATLQVNVNAKDTRVQNPSYLAAAYLGKSYYYGQFKNTVNALERALGSLSESFQKADFDSLAEYCFMYGLPKKEDILSIKRGSSFSKNLLTFKAKEYIIYTLTLPNGNILVGHKLRVKTSNFLQILHQEKNAQMLPYEAMINEQGVTILNPKYYLALSLPLLTLQEFMQIASVPDRIYRNIKKAYQ
ncbi:MAG: Unknown protein [uncultured Sulfurovum sp.]|uniref:Periplasmic protein n=1 Tax=uncultured Sulfurovum sp. TaxID=269237 RepID=A0A6S6SDM7_9BACT|nr:MAG: Unknown protein [uncultured Sulfurovum sp.]